MTAPSDNLPEKQVPRHKKKPAVRPDFQTRCSDFCDGLRSLSEVVAGVDNLVTTTLKAVTRWVCHASLLVGSAGAGLTGVTGGLNMSTAREAAPWAIAAAVGGAGTAARARLRRRTGRAPLDSSNEGEE